MTLSAHDIAAELRRRMPGIGQVQLHKLLYYCQGHHLAFSGQPLFEEPVCAWDMGPVVERLWRAEKRGERLPAPADIADNGVLNTVGYVMSRYGTATPADLIHMTHSESPWQMGDASRRAGGNDEIHVEWMRDYFRAEGAPGAGEDGPRIDDATLTEMFRGKTMPEGRGAEDDLQQLRTRIKELRERVADVA